MKVAITGGTGLVGSALTKEFQILGVDYIVLSRQIHDNSKIFTTDYSKESLKKVLKGCHAVVHLAANRQPSSQIESFHNDEIITQNIYELCVDLEIKNIIYASSISVYSDESKLAWDETQIPKPTSMYGISKLSCEMIGNYYTNRYNLKIKNFRFAHLFGFNEQNNYMVNLFMRQAFNNIQLSLNTQSVAKREFLYVNDAAKAIVEGLKKENLAGTFNIGSKNILTNYEVATRINDVFQNDKNIRIFNLHEKDKSESSYMSHKKAKELLEFEAITNFSEALEEVYTCMKGMDNVPLFY